MSGLGLGLILLGFILIFVGVALVALGGAGEWGGGAVIFIGPFPIAIGGGRLGGLALLIAVLLALGTILLLVAGSLQQKP